MSLKAFHVLFIVLSILLCFGFGAWGVSYHDDAHSRLYSWIGGASLAIGVALIGYAVWFIQKISRGIER